MSSTKKNPKLNVRLLRKIQRHIIEEPRRFFMGGVVATGTPGSEFTKWACYAYDLAETVPACGTAACIHGWTVILSGKTPAQVYHLSFEWSLRKLGLLPSWENENRLFICDDWPGPFRERYRNAKTPKQRAKIACARIDHLIKTGE